MGSGDGYIAYLTSGILLFLVVFFWLQWLYRFPTLASVLRNANKITPDKGFRYQSINSASYSPSLFLSHYEIIEALPHSSFWLDHLTIQNLCIHLFLSVFLPLLQLWIAQSPWTKQNKTKRKTILQNPPALWSTCSSYHTNNSPNIHTKTSTFRWFIWIGWIMDHGSWILLFINVDIYVY